MGDSYYEYYLAHHGILGQKWGVRRYQNPDGTLTEAGKRRSKATKKYLEASKLEPAITKDVKNAIFSSGSRMYGLQNRLKTYSSIERKLSIKDDISDAIRYTSISDDNNFVDRYFKTKTKLEDKGYKEIKCKNYFEDYKQGKVLHKSVQSVFEDPNGYRFEIQFHTPSSQDAKNKKVPIYNERRDPNISKKRAVELEKMMKDLAERVTEPKDIKKIKSH